MLDFLSLSQIYHFQADDLECKQVAVAALCNICPCSQRLSQSKEPVRFSDQTWKYTSSWQESTVAIKEYFDVQQYQRKPIYYKLDIENGTLIPDPSNPFYSQI